MAEYINKDYLVDGVHINELPTIDIVRCKDCKHRKKNKFCLVWNGYRNDNWYCADGERRINNETITLQNQE